MSWAQLLGQLRAAEEDVRRVADMKPQACPNDGEPLQPAPGGAYHCQWGGEIWVGTRGNLTLQTQDPSQPHGPVVL